MDTHVLEQARQHGTPKLVIAGTICAYPKFAPMPFREDDPGTATPRRRTHPTASRRRRSWSERRHTASSTALNAIYLLPVNLYGPRDNFDLETSHVIPALIRKMVEAEERGEDEIALWGDGSPTREFLYVDDCARPSPRGRALRRGRAGQRRDRRGDLDPRAG